MEYGVQCNIWGNNDGTVHVFKVGGKAEVC